MRVYLIAGLLVCSFLGPLRGDSPRGWTFRLEEGAYQFLGFPANIQPVRVFLIDSGIHGELVTAIIRKAIPNAPIIMIDIDYDIGQCENLLYQGAIIDCQHKVIIRAIRRAIQEGAEVINLSLGFLLPNSMRKFTTPRGCTSEFPGAVYYELLHIIHTSRAVQFIAAAGNEAKVGEVIFPGCVQRVFTSAALQRQGYYMPGSITLADYSNADYGVFASPIGGILIDPLGGVWEGTSFSTPLLTSLVTLGVSLGCSEEAIRWALERSTLHIIVSSISIAIPRVSDMTRCVFYEGG